MAGPCDCIWSCRIYLSSPLCHFFFIIMEITWMSSINEKKSSGVEQHCRTVKVSLKLLHLHLETLKTLYFKLKFMTMQHNYSMSESAVQKGDIHLYSDCEMLNTFIPERWGVVSLCEKEESLILQDVFSIWHVAVEAPTINDCICLYEPLWANLHFSVVHHWADECVRIHFIWAFSRIH